MNKISRLFSRIDSHHRLLISIAVSLTVFFSIRHSVNFAYALMISWDCFVGSVIILVWLMFIVAKPWQVKRLAGMQDSSRSLIFIVIAMAAFASVFAVIILLESNAHFTHDQVLRHVLLAILSVICSWVLLHTIFALRYAHIFYDELHEEDGHYYGYGLLFPEEKSPDYLDFAYFSFVVGMTFQVSDVEISSRKIRRLTLLHSLLSFFFNTIIVALSINVVSGLIAH